MLKRPFTAAESALHFSADFGKNQAEGSLSFNSRLNQARSNLYMERIPPEASKTKRTTAIGRNF
jgi:hypothetical protein